MSELALTKTPKAKLANSFLILRDGVSEKDAAYTFDKDGKPNTSQ
jgi:hypothetical protein